VSNIERAVKKLLTLVEQLLDLNRAATPSVAASSVIGLRELVEPLAGPLTMRDNRLVVSVPTDIVRVDVERTREVLGHLFSNAARFTQGGTIEVRAGLRPNEVWFEVRDTGVGIAPDRLPHLFHPFVQGGRDRVYTHGGTGLGLAIVDARVRAMEGYIEVESEVGRGSVFRVVLPQRDW
jgi:signal transduction histidine kinase